MRKATISMAILMAMSGSAGADENRSGVEGERVEPAQRNVYLAPGPVNDESRRLLAAPPPRNARDLLERKKALSDAVGAGRSAPRGTPPQRGGER